MTKANQTPTPPSSSIGQWLDAAVNLLKSAKVENPRLDCLVLLEDQLNQNRASILANLDKQLTKDQINVLNQQLSKRQQRIPLAYIRGVKQFYNLDFMVNPSVLIPRPETEIVIELLNELISNRQIGASAKIADVGTGSGSIAVSLAKLHPKLGIYAYDNSVAALEVAELNANKHKVQIKSIQSDLLSNHKTKFDVIIANLPYVSQDIAVEAELLNEPRSAIFADKSGLELIFKLIDQITSQQNLKQPGWLILESHQQQHTAIGEYCTKHHLKLEKTVGLVQLYKLG